MVSRLHSSWKIVCLHAFVEKSNELGTEFTEEDIVIVCEVQTSGRQETRDHRCRYLRAPLLQVQQLKIQKDFHLTIPTDNQQTKDYSSAVSLSNEEGKYLEFLANGQVVG